MRWLLITKHERSGYLSLNAERATYIHLTNTSNKKTKYYPKAFHRRLWACFTNVSNECSGCLSLNTNALTTYYRTLKYPCSSTLQDKNRIRHTLSINTDWRRATASCNKFYDSLANAHKKTRQDNHVVVTDQSKLKSACQSIQQETKSTIPMPSIRGFEPASQMWVTNALPNCL